MTDMRSGGGHGQRPEQMHDAEAEARRRQAEQAEGRARRGEAGSGGLEPRDSRNVTGQGAGAGAPGGADQQAGAERWGGDAAQDHSVAARQPTGEHPAAQDPSIVRQETQAEFRAARQQSEQGMSQSLGGMRQSLGGEVRFEGEGAGQQAQFEPDVALESQAGREGYVDQQEAGEAARSAAALDRKRQD